MAPGESAAPRWTSLALGAAILAPVAVALDFVTRFGVNMPFWDEWTLVGMLGRWHDGTLSAVDLLSLHAEHRPFFPRLLMLGLAGLTHYNAVVEMLVGWLFLAATVAVLWVEHRATFGSSPAALARFLPIPWLLCTLRQNENLLWGWQLGLYLCVLGLVVGAAALPRAQGSWGWTAVAAAAGVVAMFSFAAGALFWPVALWASKGRARWILAGVGAVAAAIYAVGYIHPPQYPDYAAAVARPLATGYFAATLLGEVFAGGMTSSASAGAAVLAVIAGLGFLWARRQLDARVARMGQLLALFGLGSLALVVLGRMGQGFVYAKVSRYATFGALALVGLWRTALGISAERVRAWATGALGALAVMATFASYDGAYEMGASVRAARHREAAVILDYRNRTDEELGKVMADPPFIRRAAEFLEAHDLGPFHTLR